MNILSIDGGGIKGLYSAAFLAGLENRYGKESYRCFDLIAGTSTGGILALAIAAKLPAVDIVEFYKEWGTRIFHTNFNITRNLFRASYSNKPLIKALKEVFKDLKIKDVYTHDKDIALCIPAIDIIQGTPIVFKTPHHPELSRDNEQYLWEIALATSSAPTIFPVANIRQPGASVEKLYIDGGLWANNPSMVALTEALTYKNQSIDNILLLSLGNIHNRTSLNSTTFKNKGLFQWGSNIVGITLDTQSTATHHQIKLLFDRQGLSNQYLRIQHAPNKGQDSINLVDSATESNLSDLEILGRSKADNESQNTLIKRIFDREE